MVVGVLDVIVWYAMVGGKKRWNTMMPIFHRSRRTDYSLVGQCADAL